MDSIGECASLLHPDHAWGSRRGSSQSEQLEVEVYELGKDFSRSLPGSRRSSFQSVQEQEAEVPAAPPPTSYSRDRRRSSCTRMLRDPDEILKSLKAVKGELGRTMSLSGDRKHRSEFLSNSNLFSVFFISSALFSFYRFFWSIHHVIYIQITRNVKASTHTPIKPFSLNILQSYMKYQYTINLINTIL